jgi:uncharacterized membrane protein YfcA
MSDGAEGSFTGLAVLAVASLVAGAVNAIAGGGTILTFPVLTAILPVDAARLVTANATSTIGLWPAALVSAWSSRGSREGLPSWARWLVVPSLVGGMIGTLLVLCLPPAWFDGLVPWLILSAAVLFSIQPSVAARAASRDGGDGSTTTSRLLLTCGLQLLVGIYGGYFGAGIGILMLAVLALLGLGDIHRLNAVKNVLATAINGVAAVVFAAGSFVGSHDVAWGHAGVMAVAAMIGSLGATHVSRRLAPAVMRKMVAIIGFGLAGYYFWRQWFA